MRAEERHVFLYNSYITTIPSTWEKDAWMAMVKTVNKPASQVSASQTVNPDVLGPAHATRWPIGCQEMQSILPDPRFLIPYSPETWQTSLEFVSCGSDLVNSWRPWLEPAAMSPGLFGRKLRQKNCRCKAKHTQSLFAVSENLKHTHFFDKLIHKKTQSDK